MVSSPNKLARDVQHQGHGPEFIKLAEERCSLPEPPVTVRSCYLQFTNCS